MNSEHRAWEVIEFWLNSHCEAENYWKYKPKWPSKAEIDESITPNRLPTGYMPPAPPPVAWCGGKLSGVVLPNESESERSHCQSWGFYWRVIEDVYSKHCFSPRRNACFCFDRLKDAWRLAESILQDEFWAPGMRSDWILIEISFRSWKLWKI